jgi:Arc/MetJ-type ribon-helix-helix transcriptional regulator
MNKMHRAQILLEPDQHQKMAEIAQREGTSISEIVRTAVQKWLNEREDAEVIRRRLPDDPGLPIRGVSFILHFFHNLLLDL